MDIQDPEPGIFTAQSLRWIWLSDLHSYNKVKREAYIYWNRIDDFIQGESHNIDHPTSFYKYSHHTNNDVKKTIWKEKITFWCAFGPTTLKRSSDNETPKRKRRVNIPRKQGCKCHFIISRHVDNVTACISYIHAFHTNQDNMICHGIETKDQQPLLAYSPWISNAKRDNVLAMLYAGFTPQQVFDNHIEEVHKRFRVPNSNIIPTRDDYLSLKDIFNISQKVTSEKYHLHDNDAESIGQWVIDNPKWIFFSQQQDKRSGKPFMLGLQSPWQREICRAFSDNNLLAMDSTFGTNMYKMALYTIMVFDTHRNGIPVAWIIVGSSRCIDIVQWLKAFRNTMLDHYKTWSPNAFLIDDAQPEQGAIRYVYIG